MNYNLRPILLAACLFPEIAMAVPDYDLTTGQLPGPGPRSAALGRADLSRSASYSALPDASELVYSADAGSDNFYLVNPSTAATTAIGALGSPVVASLAWDNTTHTLFATDTSTDNLLKINRFTGLATVIGYTGVDLLHGLAADPATGVLYAVDLTSNLYTLNKTTGAATLVGSTGHTYLNALDFDPTTGILYSAFADYDTSGALFTVDTSTGAATQIAPTHRINGMSFDADGQLYAVENGLSNTVTSSLYLVDKTTGEWTLIGDTHLDNLLGVEFVPIDGDGDGFTTEDGDCDDDDASVNPAATEVCDLIDNDCDGAVDEGYDVDADGDGYTLCDDCDDADPSVYPGAREVNDGKDNDCDGQVDEAPACGLTRTQAPLSGLTLSLLALPALRMLRRRMRSGRV